MDNLQHLDDQLKQAINLTLTLKVETLCSYVPPKHCAFSELHDITTQETTLFLATSVRT